MTIDVRLSSVPVGWRTVRLGEVCAIQLGKMLSPSSKTNQNPRPYLRNANVGWNTFDLSDVYTMEFSEREARKFELHKGDLLVCEGGEPGRAAVWGGEITPCYYQKALHRLRPIHHVDLHFIMYRLWLGALEGEFFESQTKTTIAHLPAIRLRELPISVPILPEQRRIVAALQQRLAAVDQVRAAATAQVEAAHALREVCLRRAFRGITPLAVGSVKDQPPAGWRWARLTGLARLESGHTPSRYHPEWWGGHIPWIALPDIRHLDGKTANETIEYTNEAGIANSSARVLPAGTVVLSRTASVGFVTIMGRNMATSQDFVNWVCGPDLAPEFLSYLLQVSRSYIRSLSSGATHQTVYVPTVKAFDVCVPRVHEQRQLANALTSELSEVTKMVDSAQQRVQAIGVLPHAFLRRAFSGEM